MENRTLGEQIEDHQFDMDCGRRLQEAVNEAVEHELTSLKEWMWHEKGLLAVDGYDYDSGQEMAFRRVIIQIEHRLKA